MFKVQSRINTDNLTDHHYFITATEKTTDSEDLEEHQVVFQGKKKKKHI